MNQVAETQEKGRWLITCEHASYRLPPGVDLGISAEYLRTHLGYDRGALQVARRLSRRLGAPFHRGRQSRLWVDLNRRQSNPSAIVEQTYGLPLPGNARLSDEEREERLLRWHQPYRQAALADAKALLEMGHCDHLSIHSFDPTLDPRGRDFDLGLLYDVSRPQEHALAVTLQADLQGQGLKVQLNRPYLGTPEGLTSWFRERLNRARYVGLEVEINQRAAETRRGLNALSDQLLQALGRSRLQAQSPM